jgi:hypothetical protein
VTDRCSGDVVARGKFSVCCEAAGMTALTMRAQAAALADIGNLALAEGAVSPVSNARGVEFLRNDLVVTDF